MLALLEYKSDLHMFVLASSEMKSSIEHWVGN